MTNIAKRPRLTPKDRASLRLPFDPGELSHVLCRPADLARLLGVSRQAVSGWIVAGKLTLRADGLLDPVRAVRQLLANSDPSRLRAAVLRPLTRDAEVLRGEIAKLQERVVALGVQVEERDWHLYHHQEVLERFEAVLARYWVDRHLAPTLREALVELSALRKQAALQADEWFATLNDEQPPNSAVALSKEINELYEASLAGGFVAHPGETEGEGAS